MVVTRHYFVCSVCQQRLMPMMTRNAMGTVYLSMDGKPHKHEGTAWEAVIKEEEISLV